MSKAKIITFFSPKGGVGKTLIALNTAVALSLKKKKTLLLDFDLKAPQGTSKLMGLKSKYSLYDISAALKKFKGEDKKIENYLTQHQNGLHFLPAILHGRESLHIKQETIKDFLSLVVDKYEYIIIDAGSNLTDQLIATLDISSLILLVLTPDITSLYQIEWAIDTLQSLGFPTKMMKIILNRAESKGGVSYQEIKLLLIPETLSLMPSDGKIVGFSVNKGIPVVMDSPGSKMSIAVNKLCEELISRKKLYIEQAELLQGRGDKKSAEVTESFLTKTGAHKAPADLLHEEDLMVKLKKKIHTRLLEEIDLKKLPVESMMAGTGQSNNLKKKAEQIVTNIIADEAGGFISSREVRAKIIKEVIDEALGLGPLEDLLGDAEVTEIMVNNKDQVYIEKAGKLELTTKKFTSNRQVRIVIERILSPLGRRIDESSPYVDARLSDGSRVNAIIPPLSLSGPTLTIRKFARERLLMEDLVKYGSISPDAAAFLKAAVISRKNILVSGGTGSGKTTFLNILSSYIPKDERIVTIEDSAELKLDQTHWVRLESRPPNIEGRGAIAIEDLFKNTLRMRPDRIVVGECRGKEVLDMLQAMNTGHDGSMSTVHANSPDDVLIRLDSMILMSGIELPLRAIREMIASAIDLIVHVSRMPDGTRKMVKITEIIGMLDETHIDLKDVFMYKQTGIDEQRNVQGYFTPLGHVPSFYDEMQARGIKLSKEIFSPKQ